MIDCRICERLYATSREAASCERRHLHQRRAALAAAYPLGRDWTLDTFPADDEAGRRALTIARDWIDWYDQTNLIVSGTAGAGKTGLAIAVCRALINLRADVTFLNSRAALEHVRRGLTIGVPSSILRDAKTVEVLALDDLGSERPTAWALEQLLELIDHRYVNRATTIVTSNYDLPALARRLRIPDDPVSGVRIVSRLRERATGIHLHRPDQRLRTLHAVAQEPEHQPTPASRAEPASNVSPHKQPDTRHQPRTTKEAAGA